VNALKQIEGISSAACVRDAKKHFSSVRMADDYQRLYSLLMEREELLKAA
jgi:hypothetical protein